MWFGLKTSLLRPEWGRNIENPKELMCDDLSIYVDLELVMKCICILLNCLHVKVWGVLGFLFHDFQSLWLTFPLVAIFELEKSFFVPFVNGYVVITSVGKKGGNLWYKVFPPKIKAHMSIKKNFDFSPSKKRE